MKIIGGIMIGNSNYIGTRLNGSIQEVKSKVKKPIQFIQKNGYINKCDRTSYWVGHSKLK